MGLHIRIALGLALCSFIENEFNICLGPNKISIQVFKTHTHTQTHTKSFYHTEMEKTENDCPGIRYLVFILFHFKYQI